MDCVVHRVVISSRFNLVCGVLQNGNKPRVICVDNDGAYKFISITSRLRKIKEKGEGNTDTCFFYYCIKIKYRYKDSILDQC